jgi:hypothetical protein
VNRIRWVIPTLGDVHIDLPDERVVEYVACLTALGMEPSVEMAEEEESIPPCRYCGVTSEDDSCCVYQDRHHPTDPAEEEDDEPVAVLVEVDVATCRPPKIDARIYTWVSVERTSRTNVEVEAEETACLMALCHPSVVMPVGARIIEWEES